MSYRSSMVVTHFEKVCSNFDFCDIRKMFPFYISTGSQVCFSVAKNVWLVRGGGVNKVNEMRHWKITITIDSGPKSN